MAIKIYKATSAGRRKHSVTDYSVLRKTHKTPKGLVSGVRKHGGRNNSGKITVRHQGGAPFWYDATLVAGAAYYLIRQLLVGLNQRERRLLVMDPDSGAFDAVANLKDIAKMYQEEFTELLKKLPLAKRPLLGTITVPEFQVPGSRSRLFRGLWKGQAS
jgi:hypothetical protein